MKVIVFGIGNYYREQKEKLNSFSNIEIMAFADNNARLWNKKMDGVIVIPPESIYTLKYDKILIMSIYVCAIYEQLLSLGVDERRVITWERFCAESLQGKRDLFYTKSERNDLKGSILIITTVLGYNGGTFAAVYAAMALQQQGKTVLLAAPEGSRKLIDELTENRINVAIWYSLPYLFHSDKKWIQQFELVIVNTFQMLECAYEINKTCPTLWWIHEPSEMYDSIMMKYPNSRNKQCLEDLHIYAVSKIAQENFNRSYGINECKKVLMLGIPDKTGQSILQEKQGMQKVFAIIGTVQSLKAQDLFLKAAVMLDDKKEHEFLVIGRLFDNAYCHKVKKMAESLTSVKFLGELTREDIDKVYKKIDVIVCMSYEETLSMTVVEALMYGKVCITTNTTGIAEYIKDGVNGFVISGNDADTLREKMEWIIHHEKELENIKINARKTYEKYFSMNVFGKNLESAFNDIKRERESLERNKGIPV